MVHHSWKGLEGKMYSKRSRALWAFVAGGALLVFILWAMFFSGLFFVSPEQSREQRREARSKWMETEEYVIVERFVREAATLSSDKEIPIQEVIRHFFSEEIVFDEQYESIHAGYVLINWNIKDDEGENWYFLVPTTSLGENWPAVRRDFQLVPFRGISRDKLPQIIDVIPGCK